MTPILCMITDRRRHGGEDALVRRVAEAARAGAHLVQVRERDLDGGPLFALVTRCLAAVQGTGARILVNDRLDVALAAGAHGVHLRGDSMPAARVRAAVPPGFLIGRSVHGAGEAAQVTAAGGPDYLLFGPVFATESKPGAPPAGLLALTAAAAATPLPVLAVGGVSPDRLSEVQAAGAMGAAAIGWFAGGADEGRMVLAR